MMKLFFDKLHFWQIVKFIPIALPVILVMFSFACLSLLVLGQFKTPYIILAGLIFSGFGVWAAHRFTRVLDSEHYSKENKVVDLLVIFGVILWVSVNSMYASQYVFINRDPGVYTNAAKWLVSHESAKVPIDNIFQGVNNISISSSGIWQEPNSNDHVTFQGMHLLPALLATAGRIGGEAMIFTANNIIGGIAILSFYAFSRLLVKPKWALLGVLTVGASLPMIYFSRGTYTEPLLFAFTFISLVILWAAYKQSIKEVKKPYKLLWLFTGLILGAGALPRPDGYLTIAVVVGAVIVGLLLEDKKKIYLRLRQFLWFILGVALPCILSWVDMVLLNAYNRKDMLMETIFLVALIILGVLLVWIQYKFNFIKKIISSTRKWGAPAAVILVMLITTVFIIEPLFVQRIETNGNVAGSIMKTQSLLGDPVTPRSYAEESIKWVEWYTGGPIAILGLIGIMIAVYRIVNRKNLLLMPVLLVVVLTSIFYLYHPRITPDQIWASRRLLPVIIPGVILFGVFAIEQIYDGFIGKKNKYKNTLLILASIIIIAQPLIVSRPFLLIAERGDALSNIEAICKQAKPNTVFIWLGYVLELDGVQTTRGFCNVASYGYNYKRADIYKSEKMLDEADLRSIATRAYKAGYEPVIVAYGTNLDSLDDSYRQYFKRVAVKSDIEYSPTLIGPPYKTIKSVNSVEVSVILPNGSLSKPQ